MAMPRLGTFNLHAALLPQYRGAAPINWAIINGDTQTGITTFFLDHDIDTGKVIKRVPVPILDTDNAEDVHDKLMLLGADLVKETVDDILNDNVCPIPQSELTTDEPLRHAPKIFKETCRIDWTSDVKKTYVSYADFPPTPQHGPSSVTQEKTLRSRLYATAKESLPMTLGPERSSPTDVPISKWHSPTASNFSRPCNYQANDVCPLKTFFADSIPKRPTQWSDVPLKQIGEYAILKGRKSIFPTRFLTKTR